MKKTIQHILLVAVGVAMTTVAMAQDPHLSQYFNAPQHLNPALTGGMDYDVRVSGHYRSQWGSVSVPFNTAAVDAEMSIHQGLSEDDLMGAGIYLMNDQAGDGNLRRTTALLSYSYFKSLGAEGTTYLSLGVQAGVMQQSVDFTKLYFDNQYNGDVLDNSQSSGETSLDKSTFIVPDVSAGIGLQAAAAENVNVYGGVSMFHLNEANLSMATTGTALWERKLHAYLGADVMIGETFVVSPRAIYVRQGIHSEINAGVVGKVNFGANRINDDPNAFYLGVMYRIDSRDAVVPMVRFDYGPIGVAFTYDVNMSALTRASGGLGGPELAIIYKANFDGSGTQSKMRNNRGMPCPKF
jgi:type IX secretion system PorP/SprF family membrane protein